MRRRYLAYGSPMGSPPQGASVTDPPHHAHLTSLPAEVPAWRALYRLVGDAWHWFLDHGFARPVRERTVLAR